MDKNVVETVNKVFKPTVKNVSSPKLRANYNKKAEVVFKTINDMKPSFLDDAGNVVTDRNPKTLYEFYQAFPETKTAIFNTYDDISKKSGEA